MIRSMSLVLLAMVSAGAHAEIACESNKAEIGDILDVSCPLAAAKKPQTFLFKVNFLGGHDDTVASMTPALEGQPLTCAEGSKVHLQGEEGEVSLLCRFTLPANTKQAFSAQIKWSHADYDGFKLTAE